MTRVRAPLLALLAFVAVFAVACGGDEGDDGTPDPSEVDAAELLESSAARMEEVESFHFELTHEGGTTQLMPGVAMESAEGEVVVPDRMQMTAEASAGPVGVEISLVILPEQSYMTNPLTGRWEEQDISLDGVFDPASGVPGIMRAIQDAEVTSTASVGGAQTYVVEAMVDVAELEFLGGGSGAAADQIPARAWIGVDDPLVHRLEVEGAVNDGEPADLIRRLELSRFDEAIEIQPPR